MTKDQIFEFFKSTVVKSHINNDPNLTEEALAELSKTINQNVKMDTPLNAIGLDSITMIWIMVQFDEEMKIDTSGVSFFEIHDVNDLCEKVHGLSQ